MPPAPTPGSRRVTSLDRFDILPLLVATDGAVAAFGRDVRRLRPNIVIGGVEGLAERDWPGAELHIGDAIVRLDSLRGRCPMTTSILIRSRSTPRCCAISSGASATSWR